MRKMNMKESGKSELFAFFQFITPQQAKNYLDSNHPNNRKINPKVVESYASQMLKGLWQPDTGESVKIDVNGKLIDAQHRLSAVILANSVNPNFKGVEMLVMTGIPEKAITAIDDGYKRTLLNAFQISGKVLPNQIAINSCLTVLRNLELCADHGRHYEVSQSVRRSASEMMQFFEQHKNLPAIVSHFFETFKYTTVSKTIPLGVALAMYYLFHDHNEEACFAVFKTYETGIPFDEKKDRSATYHHYHRMQSNRETRTRVRPFEHIQMFLWVYEHVCKGKNVKTMPKINTWSWDDSNPIQEFAINKLTRIANKEVAA